MSLRAATHCHNVALLATTGALIGCLLPFAALAHPAPGAEAHSAEQKLVIILTGFFNSEETDRFSPESITYVSVDPGAVHQQVAKYAAGYPWPTPVRVLSWDEADALVSREISAADRKERGERFDALLRFLDDIIQEDPTARERSHSLKSPLSPASGLSADDMVLFVAGLESPRRPREADRLRSVLGSFWFTGEGSYVGMSIQPYDFSSFSTKAMVDLVTKAFPKKPGTGEAADVAAPSDTEPQVAALPPGAFVEYDYFVDAGTGKPYSDLLRKGPLQYVIQFPGHNPHDAFLYGDQLVGFLFLESTEPGALHDIQLGLRHESKDLAPATFSYLNDLNQWKRHTDIHPERLPGQVLTLIPKQKALIGFAYSPRQLEHLETVELVVGFDLVVEGKTSNVERRARLRRTRMTEKVVAVPGVRERPPDEVVLTGPWWLGSAGEAFQDEYRKLVADARTDPEAALRLTGAGFMPRMRGGKIHFEGFFLHYDRDQ